MLSYKVSQTLYSLTFTKPNVRSNMKPGLPLTDFAVNLPN
jgi:hypothetical protein